MAGKGHDKVVRVGCFKGLHHWHGWEPHKTAICAANSAGMEA